MLHPTNQSLGESAQRGFRPCCVCVLKKQSLDDHQMRLCMVKSPKMIRILHGFPEKLRILPSREEKYRLPNSISLSGCCFS